MIAPATCFALIAFRRFRRCDLTEATRILPGCPRTLLASVRAPTDDRAPAVRCARKRRRPSPATRSWARCWPASAAAAARVSSGCSTATRAPWARCSAPAPNRSGGRNDAAGAGRLGGAGARGGADARGDHRADDGRAGTRRRDRAPNPRRRHRTEQVKARDQTRDARGRRMLLPALWLALGLAAAAAGGDRRGNGEAGRQAAGAAAPRRGEGQRRLRRDQAERGGAGRAGRRAPQRRRLAAPAQSRPPRRRRPPAPPSIRSGARYKPHVQAVTVGTSLTLVNSDRVLHNIHGAIGPFRPSTSRCRSRTSGCRPS